MTTPHPARDDELIEQMKTALSNAGAFCGDCGFEPGDRGCPDCERCWAAYAAALLPLVTADRAAVLRIVSDWCIEANDIGGVDAGDLAYRLETAGYPLPDDDEGNQG